MGAGLRRIPIWIHRETQHQWHDHQYLELSLLRQPVLGRWYIQHRRAINVVLSTTTAVLDIICCRINFFETASGDQRVILSTCSSRSLIYLLNVHEGCLRDISRTCAYAVIYNVTRTVGGRPRKRAVEEINRERYFGRRYHSQVTVPSPCSRDTVLLLNHDAVEITVLLGFCISRASCTLFTLWVGKKVGWCD